MAVRDGSDPWVAGEVLQAADLNQTFASKVDYALPVNAQTGTTYTFVAADAEKLTTASNASPVTLTIPPASSVAWPDNTVLRVVNYGAGAVTIDGGSGVTVTNTSSTIAQYGAAVAIRTGSDAWTVVPFGGGDIPAATVSSPAATGQYTDTGITYDYYTFTASGTLTVDTAGFADVLVVGGGGSGAIEYGGGGGAGGHLYITDAYLPAGSLTVTVGAGGAAPQILSGGGGNPGKPGSASRVGSYYSVGGGGGGSRLNNFSGSPSNVDNAQLGGSGGGGTLSTAGAAGLSGIGNNGGTGSALGAGGGGGAGAVGGNGSSGTGGAGGAGAANSITGSSVTRCGGGGGGGDSTGGAAGSGGGGAGATGSVAGSAGTANTGGGGGGTESGSHAGGAGGSGVVIVRVKV